MGEGGEDVEEAATTELAPPGVDVMAGREEVVPVSTSSVPSSLVYTTVKVVGEVLDAVPCAPAQSQHLFSSNMTSRVT
jgi:hypothetical protein